MIHCMTGDLLIRQAKKKDFADLLPLFEELDSLHRTQLPEQFQKPVGNARSLDFYCELLADPDTALFVAEKKNQILGFVQIMLQETPAIEILVPRVYGVIDSLLVSADQQRQGLGEELVQAAENWARSRGAEYLDLNVYSFNHQAIGFYSNLGFSEISLKYRREIEDIEGSDQT